MTDTVIQASRDEVDRRVLAALTSGRWDTADELAEACDVRPYQADGALKRLCDRGLAVHDGYRHYRKNPPIGAA
jgi:Mn-dependent DtxR family transcriptional regulator